MHTIHSKGEGHNGGPRGKDQRPSLWYLRTSTYPCMYAVRNGGEEKHARARWCITKIPNLNLTLMGVKIVLPNRSWPVLQEEVGAVGEAQPLD